MRYIDITHKVRIADSIRVGAAIYHPSGRLVYIIAGTYLSGGRVSNFWHWQEILSDGTLSPKVESGYGWSN